MAMMKVKEILDVDDDAGDLKNSGKTEQTREEAALPMDSRPTHISDFESQELSQSMLAAQADTNTTKKKQEDDDDDEKDGVVLLPKGPSSTELKVLAVGRE